MTTIVVVLKSGGARTLCVKEFAEEDLFKKAGFKSAADFLRRAQWCPPGADPATTVSVFGKASGRAGHENESVFPREVEGQFFGNCVVVKHCAGEPTNISLAEWTAWCEGHAAPHTEPVAPVRDTRRAKKTASSRSRRDREPVEPVEPDDGALLYTDELCAEPYV
jgi:hypothetical protein